MRLWVGGTHDEKNNAHFKFEGIMRLLKIVVVYPKTFTDEQNLFKSKN